MCLLVGYLLRCTHRTVASVGAAMENRRKTGNDNDGDDNDVA